MEAAPPGGEQPEQQPKRKHRRGQGSHRRYRRDAGDTKATRQGNTIAREKRLEQVATLRIEGLSIRGIAKQLGKSVGTIHSDLNDALERTVDRTDAAIRVERAVSLERIELATKGLIKRLKKGDAEAINAFVKLDARRAKLLGLDVPIKAELTGPDGGAIPIAAPTSQLESKLDDLWKRLAGGASAVDAATAPAASTGSEHAGNEPGGSAGAQSGSSP